MASRKAGGFTLVELLVVIVIIALLAALLMPAIIRALCSARQGVATHLIEGLSQATDMYNNEQGGYPENGTGSTTLALRLKAIGGKKLSYWEFRPDDLDASGNIVSPIHPTVEILYYKNNRINFPQNQNDAAVHNKQRFDLWCMDCSGVSNGCNNWGGN